MAVESGKGGRLEGTTGNTGAPTVEQQINSIGFGRFQWTLLLVFGLLVVADGMELVVISMVYVALHKQWGISQVEAGVLAGAVFVGVLAGNLLGGYLGDRWGRRNTLISSGVLFIIFAAASAFAPDIVSLALLRMCVGVAVGCKVPSTVAIAVELVPSHSRGKVSMLVGGIGFAIGEIFVCLVGMLVHRFDPSDSWWRWLLLGCVIPDVFGVPLAWFIVPESPHFLLTQGRHEDVQEIIRDIAKQNDNEEALLQDGRVKQMVEEPDQTWSMAQLFSPQLRMITMFTTLVWIVCAFAYHGHVFVYPLALQQRYNLAVDDQMWAIALAGAAEIPGIVLAMYLMEVEGIGRRLSVLGFFVAGAVGALIVPLTDDSTSFLIANMALKTLINAPFCILYVWAAELFPTSHRASGIAFSSSMSRVTGSCAPAMMAWCIMQSLTLTYQVFSIILAVGAIVIMTFKFETLNLNLKEFAYEAYEGQDAETLPLKAGPAPAAHRA